MQKFPIFPSYSFLSLTKFRLSPKGTNKGKKCFTAFSPRYCFGVCVRWDQVSATWGAFLIHRAVCGQTCIWQFIAFWTDALWSECRRHSPHIGWAFAIQSSCRLGEKREDLVVCLWLPPPWKLWEACLWGVFLQRAAFAAAGCPPLSDLPQKQGRWQCKGTGMPLLTSLPLVFIDMLVRLHRGRRLPLKGQHK